jgi:hypothetical protein
MTANEIKLKIQEEEDLYAPIDPDRTMLSEEVVDYLSRVFLSKHRRLREEYVLRIISDTPVNGEHVKETIRGEFNRQKDDIHYALKRLRLKPILLTILGAAILSVWLFLSATAETVGVEILSIMGWVCIWKAFSIAVLQRPDLRREWLNLERLVRADIVFQLAEDAGQDAAE